jgi:hypothetical protein
MMKFKLDTEFMSGYNDGWDKGMLNHGKKRSTSPSYQTGFKTGVTEGREEKRKNAAVKFFKLN